jgi:hypothetical protein
MTQHARNHYRKHGRGLWLALGALVAVCAVVAAPLATGAPPKLYTLTASPDSVCFTGTGQTQQFTLTVTNQSRNTRVGSANITAPSFITLTPGSLGGAPADSSLDGNVVQLRNLNLSAQGAIRTVTVSATISAVGTGNWASVAKQSNDFADEPGPGNLVTLQGSPPPLAVAACQYVFTQGPVDALRNAAQTVKVQLQAGTTPVAVSGPLTLTAGQTVGTTTTAVSSFTGLTDADGQDATKTWSFSVIGTVSGTRFTLRVGSGAAQAVSDEFDIAIASCTPGPSGTCNIPFTPTDDGGSGASVNGSGVASPIALSFEPIPQTAIDICGAGWGWSPLEFPDPTEPDGTGNFDGLVLSDFTYAPGGGSLLVTTYLRNDLYVQTDPDNTNDIEVCAGGRHAHSANGDPADAFMGRAGIMAEWDAGTQLYWGVLERIPNCNRARDLNADGILDPALCGWGTVDIEGVTYRTAKVIVPYDWDWKGVT